MQISAAAWNNYIAKMSRISSTAAKKMLSYVANNGFSDMKAVLDYAYALSEHYGKAIGALACQMYDATAAAQGADVPEAEMAELPEYGEVAKTVYGAKKKSESEVSRAIGRLVKRTGADTTLKNAERDGAQFAWVPHGDTCAFCITLASRGWQYMSKNALKNGHAEHIHAHCDCQYAVRFDSTSGVKGYDPDKYREMYDNAEGSTPQEKINSMRRGLSADQAYRKVVRGESSTASFVRDGNVNSISVKKIETYDTPVYISDNVKIKPKALNAIVQNTNQAAKEYGLSTEENPAIVVLAQNELDGALGLYDAVTNTAYYNELATNSKFQRLAGGKKVIERHETWHARQAADYRGIHGQITEENKTDYIKEICKKSKKNLDSLGITAENVSEISEYASDQYWEKRYDETEAEVMALRKGNKR